MRLIVGKTILTQPLLVKMDPRIKTPASGLAEQFRLASEIAEAMNKDFFAIEAVRSVRAQLKQLKANNGAEELLERLTSLDAQAALLEGEEQDPHFAPPMSASGPKDLTSLNRKLQTLLRVVDGTDAAPTPQALATYRELKKSLQVLLASWQVLHNRDVAQLNEALRRSNLAEIRATGSRM